MSEANAMDLLQSRVALLQSLQDRCYTFITPTPATHARVIARRQTARDLRDVFGWSLPFSPDAIDKDIVELLKAANALEEQGGLLKSRLRVSSLGDDLFLHSAFPTTQQDAVFLGPDSYRFAAFIQYELPRSSQKVGHLVDIGAGAGVGAVAAMRCTSVSRVTLTDINRAALELAQASILCMAQGGALQVGAVDFLNSDCLDGVEDRIQTIIANPPYIADPAHRAYRDGGGMHGGEVSLAWARQAAARLERGGAFLLYTGSAIIDGEDRLKAALFEALDGFDISYRELDPDVFGEELEREDYADVERIAVVGLVAVKR